MARTKNRDLPHMDNLISPPHAKKAMSDKLSLFGCQDKKLEVRGSNWEEPVIHSAYQRGRNTEEARVGGGGGVINTIVSVNSKGERGKAHY